jgi:glycine/D-amino acid oxidase-like deaminating enzyme
MKIVSDKVLWHEPEEIDVAIIGGGLTGFLSAYLLSKAGKRVVIVEKNTIDSGATKYTTAFITQAIDTDYADLIDDLGKDKAKLIADSHKEAIDLIEKIVSDEKIDCAFMRVSNYAYANAEKDFEEDLRDEQDALRAVGIRTELGNKNLGFIHKGYLEFKNQAKFDVHAFIQALAKILRDRGVMIYEHEEVMNLHVEDESILVETSQRIIRASYVIAATYEPFHQPLRVFFKKALYVSYVMQVEIPHGIIPVGMYEDTEDPYHYFRIDEQRGKDIMTIGGEDHRNDIPVKSEKNFKALEDYLKCIIPHVKYKKKSRWSGPILEPVDGLAYIGALQDKKIMYAFGFSGNGMTYAAISAQIFTDAVMKRKNRFAELYRADRIPSLKLLATKGRDYGRELIHGAVRNTLKK